MPKPRAGISKIYRLRLDINPVPAARPKLKRRGKGTYYPTTYATFRKEVKALVPFACMQAGIGAPVAGPLIVAVACVCKRPKVPSNEYPSPDVDNYAKAVLDCLNGQAWIDDKQILGLVITKEWASPGEEGHIEIEFKEVNEPGIQTTWARVMPRMS